jgi:hypothetical protein
MWGITPPPAMVALMSVSSSSSPRICAKHRCAGAPRSGEDRPVGVDAQVAAGGRRARLLR